MKGFIIHRRRTNQGQLIHLLQCHLEGDAQPGLQSINGRLPLRG